MVQKTHPLSANQRDPCALTIAHPIVARLCRQRRERTRSTTHRHHRPLLLGPVGTATHRVSARTHRTSPAPSPGFHSGQGCMWSHWATGSGAPQVVFLVTWRHRASLSASVQQPQSTVRNTQHPAQL